MVLNAGPMLPNAWKINLRLLGVLVNNVVKGKSFKTKKMNRWHNHLDPYIKKDPICREEERKIFELHKKLGNKWADIAKELPGRSDNCIKNYFYSTHRKH